jgi:CBS domain-containing membrane protein
VRGGVDRPARCAGSAHELSAHLPDARLPRVHHLHAPLSPRARPREVVIGQWLGIGLGYVAALAFGLDRGSLSSLEADWRHVGSSSLALALTIAALLALRLDQSSACAVSLIVALGIWEAWELGVLAGAVLALLALGFLLNRAAGLRYPLWAGDLD